MVDFSAEIALVVFCLVNAVVCGGAWFFASRRMTASRSQAILDAALLGYGMQYAAVGLPGLIRCLDIWTIDAVALGCAGLMVVGAWGRSTLALKHSPEPGALGVRARVLGIPQSRRVKLNQYWVVRIALFVGTVIAAYVRSQASLPVLSNDALTYHFPAATQWLQQGKISLFQTWFFNPANTYSPLAGSMFIVWLMAPFGNDVLARFVQVPALVCVGIAMARLCREMGTRAGVAGAIAGAAMLARPIFLPCMMGKDDLFVAFFFIATLVALSPERAREPFGPARFGLALGLLLATKYTALLMVPILLLAIDGPGWRARGWITAIAVAMLIAGPWYVRNLILTGNPVFPMFSLFTTSASQAFDSWPSAVRVVVGGSYGMPMALTVILGICWICSWRFAASAPIRRTCVLGVVPGMLLFYLRSPFPEVRFVLPVFLVLFAATGMVIDRSLQNETLASSLAIIVLVVSLATVFVQQFIWVIAGFAGVALAVTLAGLIFIWWADGRAARWGGLGLVSIICAALYGYVHWKAYCHNYRETLFDDGTGYAVRYPESISLWRFVNENIPADARVAYTNLYLVYPLQGPTLRRRLVYAPTRAGVITIADLGWLGSDLPGEKLIPAAVRATVESPGQKVWLANLEKSGAEYLIVGKGGVIGVPPEAGFAGSDRARFTMLFDGPGGWVYQCSDRSQGRNHGPPGRR